MFRAYDSTSARWLSKYPIEEAGGLNLYGYVGGNPLTNTDPLGLINLKIPGVSRGTTIHANPGPEATAFRPDHNPPHVHLGTNDGPRVDTQNFEPLDESDARKMTKEQKKMCKDLSSNQKDLIRSRQKSVFKNGSFILRALSGPTMLTPYA